ncbi:MAG TPA: hypothetical protein DCS07_09175 [Bdellovibrionales bacterium]|nr:MAG: hypothetical protein A2Z97_14160 [Bdellovibrionales bacterium GWB1_52_6]OFZ04505.1 MAG: hypothetical protein A2X97_10295 [Bdellovibrionales bacterium GWA1_52_35]OFZ37674.1 MAG: hypothetical protein A2070_00760 [Bdellovibrionales bacterium GWC1_52_8]HAR42781.1 hypothetical protein [Bdellovibrionales bacterium]HCM38697.1 hypothetical protein [Bdellovibrionales bacterium]
MRFYHLTLAALLLALIPNVFASQKFAITFGGNCNEGKPSEAALDEAFANAQVDSSIALKTAGWDVTPLYDKQHERFVQKAAGKISKTQIRPASRQALYDALDEIIGTDKRAGKANDNSQLLITFATHGSQADHWNSHGICLNDGTILDLSDSGLQERLKRAKNVKHMKLAFLDDSCYGGGSIPVLKSYGCVISAQSALLESHTIQASPGYGSMAAHNALKILLSRAAQNKMSDLGATSMDDVFLAALWLGPRNADGTLPEAQSAKRLSGGGTYGIYDNHTHAQSSDFEFSGKLTDHALTLSDSKLELPDYKAGHDDIQACASAASSDLSGALAGHVEQIAARDRLEGLCRDAYGKDCVVDSRDDALRTLKKAISEITSLTRRHQSLLERGDAIRESLYTHAPRISIPIKTLPEKLGSNLAFYLDDSFNLLKSPAAKWHLQDGNLVIPLPFGEMARYSWASELLGSIQFLVCGENKACKNETSAKWQPVLDKYFDDKRAAMTEGEKEFQTREYKKLRALKNEAYALQPEFYKAKETIQRNLLQIRAYLYFDEARSPLRKSHQCRDFTF